MIYFVQRANGLVKIGYSSAPASRLRAISYAIGEPVTVLLAVTGTRALERHLHDRFAASRQHGEWFALSGELFSTIDELKNGTFGFSEPSPSKDRQLSPSQERYVRLENYFASISGSSRDKARRELSSQLGISRHTLRGIRDGRSNAHGEQAAAIRDAYILHLKERIASLSHELAETQAEEGRTERLLLARDLVDRANALLGNPLGLEAPPMAQDGGE